jgi:hypothetical protein
MAHPTGETSNKLLAALEKLEGAFAEDSQLFKPWTLSADIRAIGIEAVRPDSIWLIRVYSSDVVSCFWLFLDNPDGLQSLSAYALPGTGSSIKVLP